MELAPPVQSALSPTRNPSHPEAKQRVGWRSVFWILFPAIQSLVSFWPTNGTTHQAMDESLPQRPAPFFTFMPVLKPPGFRQLPQNLCV
jgi:hypothetical protein